MAFLTKDDLTSIIRVNHIDELTSNNDSIVEKAIADAEDKVRNFLHGPGYDVDLILAADGDARSKTVLLWVKFLAKYYLYHRSEDDEVPERVIKDYDDTIAELKRVSDGRMNLALPHQNNEDGSAKTKFRGGGDAPRRNSIR